MFSAHSMITRSKSRGLTGMSLQTAPAEKNSAVIGRCVHTPLKELVSTLLYFLDNDTGLSSDEKDQLQIIDYSPASGTVSVDYTKTNFCEALLEVLQEETTLCLERTAPAVSTLPNPLPPGPPTAEIIPALATPRLSKLESFLAFLGNASELELAALREAQGFVATYSNYFRRIHLLLAAHDPDMGLVGRALDVICSAAKAGPDHEQKKLQGNTLYIPLWGTAKTDQLVSELWENMESCSQGMSQACVVAYLRTFLRNNTGGIFGCTDLLRRFLGKEYYNPTTSVLNYLDINKILHSFNLSIPEEKNRLLFREGQIPQLRIQYDSRTNICFSRIKWGFSVDRATDEELKENQSNFTSWTDEITNIKTGADSIKDGQLLLVLIGISRSFTSVYLDEVSVSRQGSPTKKNYLIYFNPNKPVHRAFYEKSPDGETWHPVEEALDLYSKEIEFTTVYVAHTKSMQESPQFTTEKQKKNKYLDWDAIETPSIGNTVFVRKIFYKYDTQIIYWDNVMEYVAQCDENGAFLNKETAAGQLSARSSKCSVVGVYRPSKRRDYPEGKMINILDPPDDFRLFRDGWRSAISEPDKKRLYWDQSSTEIITTWDQSAALHSFESSQFRAFFKTESANSHINYAVLRYHSGDPSRWELVKYLEPHGMNWWGHIGVKFFIKEGVLRPRLSDTGVPTCSEFCLQKFQGNNPMCMVWSMYMSIQFLLRYIRQDYVQDSEYYLDSPEIIYSLDEVLMHIFYVRKKIITDLLPSPNKGVLKKLVYRTVDSLQKQRKKN